MLRRLHLPTVRRLYSELATRAEADGMSYHCYLETLIAEEIAHRAETRLTRAVRKAHFPFLRTIDDCNFTFQTALKLQMLGSYLGPELVSERKNAIFSGPSGTGKSHLCIAIAYRAIQHGYDARFVGADGLIGELSRAASKGRLDAALQPYLHPHVLIIDELGRTNRWRHWAMSCMMATWPRPFWIDSSSEACISCCAVARTAPVTYPRRTPCSDIPKLVNRPQSRVTEFREKR